MVSMYLQIKLIYFSNDTVFSINDSFKYTKMVVTKSDNFNVIETQVQVFSNIS